MDFRKLHLGTVSYGPDAMYDLRTQLAAACARDGPSICIRLHATIRVHTHLANCQPHGSGTGYGRRARAHRAAPRHGQPPAGRLCRARRVPQRALPPPGFPALPCPPCFLPLSRLPVPALRPAPGLAPRPAPLLRALRPAPGLAPCPAPLLPALRPAPCPSPGSLVPSRLTRGR